MTSADKKIQFKGFSGRKFSAVRNEVDRFFNDNRIQPTSLKRKNKKVCKGTKGAHPFVLIEKRNSSFVKYSFNTYKCDGCGKVKIEFVKIAE